MEKTPQLTVLLKALLIGVVMAGVGFYALLGIGFGCSAADAGCGILGVQIFVIPITCVMALISLFQIARSKQSGNFLLDICMIIAICEALILISYILGSELARGLDVILWNILHD